MYILGTRIDLIDLNETMRRILKALSAGQKLWIVTANPELIYRAEHDERLRTTIAAADLVLPDGIGVVWAARLL
ncbi:MAG: glycosyltransferase, partial [Peptococcaceae bacterium]|nr:glycosyltransferase [Peptococcaceae bacterium]